MSCGHFEITKIKFCPHCGMEIEDTGFESFGCWSCGGQVSNRLEQLVKPAAYGHWISLEKEEPPKGIYILTWHQLDRIQMQKYDGKMFNDPITCPVDEKGRPIGFTSAYPKEVIKYWMYLPSKPSV